MEQYALPCFAFGWIDEGGEGRRNGSDWSGRVSLRSGAVGVAVATFCLCFRSTNEPKDRLHL
jgi:hypothetical protein